MARRSEARTKITGATADAPDCYDVVVVGGGAAGLTMAVGLAQAGMQVLALGVPRIIHDDGRSAALFESNLELLDRLGLGDALRVHGAPLRAIRLIDIAGGLVRAPSVTFKALEIGQDVFGWNIPNAQIIAVLKAKAGECPGLTLSDAFFERYRAHGPGLDVTLSDGRTAGARLLIGADGQKSQVRQAAGIGVTITPYPQAAITCRLRHQKDHEDISLEFHTREGPFTFVPVGDHRSALVWIMRPDKAAAMLARPPAEIEEAIARLSSFLLGKVTIDGPIAAVPLQRLAAARLTVPRVALVGEAAHAFPPIGAQGLNLGLKDVESLLALISAAFAAGEDLGGDPLDRYERSRRSDVEMRSHGVHVMNTSLIADRLPLDLARAVGLALLRDVGPLRRLAMRIGGWRWPHAHPL